MGEGGGVSSAVKQHNYHLKEYPDKLLALPTVLGGEGGGGDIEEGGPTLSGHCLCQ